MATPVEWAAIGGVAGVAAMWDLRTRRVPNVLTFGAAAVGFIAAALQGGPGALGTSVLGWVVGLALFLPLFVLGGMGAGDVKLLAALGAWLGPITVCWAAIWASLAGGVLAIAIGAWHGYLSAALQNLWTALALWRVFGVSAVPALTLGESRGPKLAYAVPIGIGAVVALWLRAA